MLGDILLWSQDMDIFDWRRSFDCSSFVYDTISEFFIMSDYCGTKIRSLWVRSEHFII